VYLHTILQLPYFTQAAKRGCPLYAVELTLNKAPLSGLTYSLGISEMGFECAFGMKNRTGKDVRTNDSVRPRQIVVHSTSYINITSSNM
jgi:hypothetical protein